MTIGNALLLLALIGLVASAGLGVTGAVTAPSAAFRAPGGPAAAWRASLRAGAHGLLVVAGLALLAALVARTLLVGHAPWSNLHEVTQAVAAGLVGSFLIATRNPALRSLSPLVAVAAAALVVLALQLPDDVVPLAPALQAPLLLTVHVGAAIAAYAVTGLAFVATVGELVQARAGDRVALLPSAAASRALAHRAALVAFPLLTIAIALGSVWANLAWRSYWNNDPKELAAAGTWLLYAAYLHVAGRSDRAGRMAPWLLVAGFAAVLFTFLGASLLFPGQHSYAGV